jgi:hypothetical protein
LAKQKIVDKRTDDKQKRQKNNGKKKVEAMVRQPERERKKGRNPRGQWEWGVTRRDFHVKNVGEGGIDLGQGRASNLGRTRRVTYSRLWRENLVSDVAHGIQIRQVENP